MRPPVIECTGFFEEAPGVRSMTRLVVALHARGVVARTLALAAHVIGVTLLAEAPPDGSVIAALGVPLVALAGGIWSSRRERKSGGES